MIVSLDNRYCVRVNTEFEFFPGFSDVQKQRSIRSLHESFQRNHANNRILEISSKSEEELGVRLSAFNLMIKNKAGTLPSQKNKRIGAFVRAPVSWTALFSFLFL